MKTGVHEALDAGRDCKLESCFVLAAWRMRMKNYILAHDLGTTGNEATLYDREGAPVGSAFYGYETEYAQTGRHRRPAS